MTGNPKAVIQTGPRFLGWGKGRGAALVENPRQQVGELARPSHTGPSCRIFGCWPQARWLSGLGTLREIWTRLMV